MSITYSARWNPNFLIFLYIWSIHLLYYKIYMHWSSKIKKTSFLLCSGRYKHVSYGWSQETDGNASPSDYLRWKIRASWPRARWQRCRWLWRWRWWNERNKWKFWRQVPLVQLSVHIPHLESRKLCCRLGINKIF